MASDMESHLFWQQRVAKEVRAPLVNPLSNPAARRQLEASVAPQRPATAAAPPAWPRRDLKAPRAATPLYRQPVSYAPGKVFGKAGATEADITYSDRFGTTNIRPFTPALPPPASAGSSSPRFAGSPRSTPLHPYTNSRAQQQAASIFAPRLLATPRSDIAATSWLQGRSWPPAGTGRDETRRALQRKPRPEF